MSKEIAMLGTSHQELIIDIPSKETLLSYSYKEKLIYMDKFRVHYPRINQVLEKINECHQSIEYSARPLCMRVSGPSGSGKTSIMELYKKNYPDKITSNGFEKTVVCSNTPSPPHVGDLPISLLKALGDPLYTRKDRIIRQTDRLYKLLNACKVKVLFVDEFQQLVDKTTKRLIYVSADWFKQLIDETGISIIFMGLPGLENVFIENEQLGNRVRLVEELSTFKDDYTFRRVLYMFDLGMPLKELSGLAEPDMSGRIFKASNGLMKYMHELIVKAATIAINTDSPRITMPMLAKSFDEYFKNSFIENPFLPGSRF